MESTTESGIKKTVFEHVDQRRHFGVRFHPGKSQKPDAEPDQVSVTEGELTASR